MSKRLALITGGTRGIGKAIALELQKLGYKVVTNYATNDENAKKFTEETGIKAFKWDVADFNACKESVKRIEDEYSSNIEILVNNAGITRDGMMHKIGIEHWYDVINTNLTSCFNMANLTIKQMRDNNFGRIINISSVNGLSGQVGQTNYSAAKSGIIGLTKAHARESASKKVTANIVAPGYVNTEMVSSIKEDVLNEIIKQIPVGRLAEPFEIARAVSFLASEDAGFITGETLSVNGGQRME